MWLTYDDGVDFALNLQGAAATAKYVDDLFQLRLLDHQVVFLLKVLLQSPRTVDMKTRSQHSTEFHGNGNKKYTYFLRLGGDTHHPPFLPLQLQQRSFFRRSSLWGRHPLWSLGLDRCRLWAQTRVLVGLLVIWDMLQTWWMEEKEKQRKMKTFSALTINPSDWVMRGQGSAAAIVSLFACRWKSKSTKTLIPHQ